MHPESVPSLAANVEDAACYYQRPGVADVPAVRPAGAWSCNDDVYPQCPWGCEFEKSRWSDGTPEFNCKMRKLAWEFGQQLRPDYAGFEDLFHALGLNVDCKDEVSPPTFTAADRAPPSKYFPVSSTAPGGGIALFVDFTKGSDSNAGSLSSPFKTVQAAVVAAANKPAVTVNLRGGTHYLSAAVQISAANRGLTIQNYLGEVVTVSGAVPLVTPRWEKYNISGAGAGANAWVADVSAAGFAEFPGLNIDGKRVTRARYPNGNPELPERDQPASGNPNGSALLPGAAASWVGPDPSLLPKTVQVINSNRSQDRNGSVVNGVPVYTTYMGGIGGPCERYDPPFSYWCSTSCAGGGAKVSEIVRGITPPKSAISPPGGNADAGLHMPYKTMKGAIVNAMHDLRWANWMFEVAEYDPATNGITFGRGGFQESRGTLTGRGGDYLIENVLEEFDAPNEFLWSGSAQTAEQFRAEPQLLYYYHNGVRP